MGRQLLEPFGSFRAFMVLVFHVVNYKTPGRYPMEDKGGDSNAGGGGDEPQDSQSPSASSQQEPPDNNGTAHGDVSGGEVKPRRRYFRELLNEGPDRHIELLLTIAIATFSCFQLLITCSNNRSTSQQSERLLQSANRIDDAADSFSTSSAEMSRSFNDAVGKLGDQVASSHDFATLTKNQFIQDQRPYIWYDYEKMEAVKESMCGLEPPNGPNGSINAGRLVCQVWLKNYGKSPAVRAHSLGYISVKQPDPEDPDPTERVSEEGVGSIYPAGSGFFKSPRTKEKIDPALYYTFRSRVTETVMAIHIDAVYYDLSGNRYASHICLAVQGNGVPKSCNKEGKIQ